MSWLTMGVVTIFVRPTVPVGHAGFQFNADVLLACVVRGTFVASGGASNDDFTTPVPVFEPDAFFVETRVAIVVGSTFLGFAQQRLTNSSRGTLIVV